MVQTDWERIFSVNPSTLTDDEIEDLCPAVIHCDVDDISDVHNLRFLVKLSQEMLQYKDNQVESLLIECGELKQTISSLKPEAAKRKKKERETSDIKQEPGTFSKRTEVLDSVKYEDILQGKNLKIKTLMTELESVEKENMILKDQLTTLTREMEDATEKMNRMSEELSSTRIKSNEYKEKMSYLERENVALVTQFEELTAQQIDRDKVIDEFGVAIDARITEWKKILDERDAEISRLRESLSQSVMHSVSAVKEQSKSEILNLNEEIDRRDKVIAELQTKLSEAVVEINESSTIIEKLKVDAQKAGKSDRRKEQRDLLKKLQDTNQKISDLQSELVQTQEDANLKGSKLCEVLETLRKYEDENQGLTDALNEIKKLSIELHNKNEHIQDLVNVVNKLEMLNSYQEMEIMSLREKLGIPEDESTSIQNVLAKRKEEMTKMEELVQQNKILAEENLELKSDIRVLKHKLNKSAKEFDFSNVTVDGSADFLHSTKLQESESRPFYSKTEISELKNDMQIVVEENEALRTGMHEILDSIRNQDGKSEVEIQSATLERLLEALDVRHLAGWYHPAMRLQEHLSVVQGSNNELRSQLKQLRKELQRKDSIIQHLALSRNTDIEKIYAEESENEKLTTYLSEMQNLQEAYQNEAEEWERQKDSLIQENAESKNEIDKLKLQLEVYEQNLLVLEEGEDEIAKAFAIKMKEYAAIASEALVVNRKIAALQQMLNKETTKIYQHQKEAIKNESNLKRSLAEFEKRNKLLECEISVVRSNLSNSVSSVVYNELKEKYEETHIRFRNILENNLILKGHAEMQSLKDQLEVINREKYQLIEHLKKEVDYDADKDELIQQLKEISAKELMERQRADHITRLYEISQEELKKYEENIEEIIAAKSELQEQLIALHKKLPTEIHVERSEQLDENKVQELKDNNVTLKIESESLKKLLQISEEEAQLQYSLNSLNTSELDSLRHQILNLQAVSEDKATISRLDFELKSAKYSEVELTMQKTQLENELARLEEELEKSKRTSEGLRVYVNDCRKSCENRCRTYLDILGFLKSQYAGSTSVSFLDKYISLSEKLKAERQAIDSEMKKAKECHDNAKVQQEMLNNRLQIVESLKDILEQQIGSNSVQDIMQRFSEYSQHTLSDFKYKRKIAQLEYDLQIANNKFTEYESIITNMEQDIIQAQRAWVGREERQSKRDVQILETNVVNVEARAASVQAAVEVKSMETQTEPYTCCLDRKDFTNVEVQTIDSKTEALAPKKEGKDVEKPESDAGENKTSVVFLHEQLNQALKLASDRSASLIKCESQMTECQAKIEALNKTIETKDSQLAQNEKLLEEYKIQPHATSSDCSDKLALKSTINSLQKLISQKEETVVRYQNLLKEDRGEHSRAINHLQEEIKSLHNRIMAMQSEDRRTHQANEIPTNDVPSKKNDDGAAMACVKKSAMQEEEIARLVENASTLEADLNITKELSERWHRLAEERLKHMDRMRERLEEQHKDELESYRSELSKWQSEADTLRKQLSENRMSLTKGNISLMKELQERDDKIHELSLACQQLQNEIDLMSTNRSQQVIGHVDYDTKTHESTQGFSSAKLQHHSQVDVVRKQLQSLIEKEKMYKHEIADLKQRLSRRYMAVKSQEKKASQREVQLERKVKTLEEELEKMRAQLDREYLVQEVKKAKTAEELSLWEKQKKWQQTAERFKDKLKEKTDEYSKLLSNHEKLRSVVACMEREKWYLKSKLKVENNTVAGSLSARPVTTAQQNTVEELQKECQTLRERVKELTDRLEIECNEQLLSKIEEQRRHIVALEAVSNGNTYVINQMEKLEMTKDILEKINLKLESENFELRLELEKANADTPRLREKVQHLEKYIELLKVEKSSESTPRSSDKELQEYGLKKSTIEMEKTIFTLKRIIEKLQVENKRLRLNSNKGHLFVHEGKSGYGISETILQKQYEEAQKRIVALETDLQLAEHRAVMLEKAQIDDDNGEVQILRQQLVQKSELLDKVKHLLTKAAINEKSLRQHIQQLESKQTLSTIPECCVTPPTLE